MSIQNDEPAVVVKELYKSFHLPHDKHSGMKQAVLNILDRRVSTERQRVLNDISFEIKKGEFFGIVGRNGSGKSTLLKLLAGIYKPDKGLVQINGALTPFIELGVGFNPELTGRENVFLNGALLGFSRVEMQAMYDEIVSFAEIENFMDQKLKNYSSGMQVRLAFSIAIRANTPILLIDEVLAVGDTKFQNKCYAEFRKMKSDSKTIILVTHDMSAVERFCDRVLVLQSGKMLGVYTPSEASVIYERMNASDASANSLKETKENRWGSRKVTIEKIEIHDKNEGDEATSIVSQGDDVDFRFYLKNKVDSKKITIGLAFYDSFGVNIAGPNSSKIHLDSSSNVTYRIPKLAFTPGEYSLTAVVFDENSEEEFDHIEQAITFTVISNQIPQYGKINPFGRWTQK